MFTWLFSVALAVSPLEISVEPDVRRVILRCPGEKLEAEVVAGRVTFERAPEDCQVFMERSAGRISGPGIYECQQNRCDFVEVPHSPFSNTSGQIHVVLAGSYNNKSLELKCSDNFRLRTTISNNVGSFSGVPNGECTLFFKDGVPAQYRPVVAGVSYKCQITGTTVVCSVYDPN